MEKITIRNIQSDESDHKAISDNEGSDLFGNLPTFNIDNNRNSFGGVGDQSHNHNGPHLINMDISDDDDNVSNDDMNESDDSDDIDDSNDSDDDHDSDMDVMDGNNNGETPLDPNIDTVRKLRSGRIYNNL